jgi:hypothetical protein
MKRDENNPFAELILSVQGCRLCEEMAPTVGKAQPHRDRACARGVTMAATSYPCLTPAQETTSGSRSTRGLGNR